MNILGKIKGKTHLDKEETYSAPPKSTKSYSGDITTLDKLSKAIVNRTGMYKKSARKTSGFVLDLFGYDDRIIDNILDPADRQLFYLLEEWGILKTGREEYKLVIGNYAHEKYGKRSKYKPPETWRMNYWEIERDFIKECAKGGSSARKISPGEVKNSKIISNPQMEIPPENIYEDKEVIDNWNKKLNLKKDGRPSLI